MTNKEFYKETFSQVHSTAQISYEDCQRRSRRKLPRKRQVLLLAAAVALFAALSATAVAANFLGLRDILMPGKATVSVIDPATGVPVPGQTQQIDVISLSGFMNTPESQALAEWQDFLDGYDKDGSILASVGNTIDPDMFARYGCYGVYTWEMGEKLDAIAAKYGLKLHTDVIDLCAHPEALGPLADFGADQETYWTYMYKDGTCSFDGYTDVPGFGLVDVQFMRSVRGTFNEVTLNIRNVEEHVSWSYETAGGQEVLLAMGPSKSLVLADLPDCFAVFNVFIGTDGEMTQERLEALADCYDFSLLSPVTVPTLREETDGALTADDPRQAFANALWELLKNGVFPDGTQADTPWDSVGNSFAVCDVDEDGEEELVILYEDTVMAGMAAYVVAYDGAFSPLRVELCEFPALTFYIGGFVRADWSHNQGLAGSALWPYDLYCYNSAEDTYELIASVDAWDKSLGAQGWDGEPFPDDVDRDGDGVVYYIKSADQDGESEAVDGQAYQDWWRSEVGNPAESYIDYQPLTQENITALTENP